MRKALLYTLFAISAALGCFAVGVSLRDGEVGNALLWMVVLSPILINALRTPRRKNGGPLTTTQPFPEEAISASLQQSNTELPAVELKQANAIENVASGASAFFRWGGHLCLGLTVVFGICAPFFIQVAGYAIAFSILGAIFCFGLSAALR